MKTEVIAIGITILVTASLATGYGIGNGTHSTETLTSTATQTTTSTTTSILMTTMQQTVTVHLYTLTFQEDASCGPPVYIYALPWRITLDAPGGNQTETAPPGAVFPTTPAGWDSYTFHGVGVSASQTDINFTLPSGVYHYTKISPYQLNGTVNVDGTNTIVHLQSPFGGAACPSLDP